MAGMSINIRAYNVIRGGGGVRLRTSIHPEHCNQKILAVVLCLWTYFLNSLEIQLGQMLMFHKQQLSLHLEHYVRCDVDTILIFLNKIFLCA